ncbi:TIGR02270 family protein [Aquabacterium sp.]|uniref:TIGR02270 family protein n=1 Tax=Aquabacterium sp. TaxID=1872578 RepID=UPI002BB04FDE|nr:TIGR02270 family protein [Aquabacterium sp.]HSW03636.1 TIGR02270 family protein [Aquabacterium sp.]
MTISPGATTATSPGRAPVMQIVQQHAEESALLRQVRSVLVRAPHVRLNQLRRLDDRLAAHLDGLAVAGPAGTACTQAALARPDAGELFTAAVRAIEDRDDEALARLLAVAAALPAARRGVLSAFGWVSAAQLQGIARDLLGSAEAAWRDIGIAACRMHHADPGPLLIEALQDPDAGLRASALRAAGELGRLDLLPAARAAMVDDAPEVVFWAAWAACLLGDRQAALKVLGFAAQRDDDLALRALVLTLAASEFEAARDVVRAISQAAQGQPTGSPPHRRLIRAVGLLGDVQFVPWLIELMEQPTIARLAGEAFSMISGADLARQDLEGASGPVLDTGPSDNPADERVALDEDDSLPWPNAGRVQHWWSRNGGGLVTGQRCFIGRPVSAESALQVLREGLQRQRHVAALSLSLLRPGTGLFPVAAPARRQQQALAVGSAA